MQRKMCGYSHSHIIDLFPLVPWVKAEELNLTLTQYALLNAYIINYLAAFEKKTMKPLGDVLDFFMQCRLTS